MPTALLVSRLVLLYQNFIFYLLCVPEALNKSAGQRPSDMSNIHYFTSYEFTVLRNKTQLLMKFHQVEFNCMSQLPLNYKILCDWIQQGIITQIDENKYKLNYPYFSSKFDAENPQYIKMYWHGQQGSEPTYKLPIKYWKLWLIFRGVSVE